MPKEAPTPVPPSSEPKTHKREVPPKIRFSGMWLNIRRYFAGSNKSKPPDSIVNWWLLFATVIIAVIYALQLRAMLESNAISRDSLQSVQRAFVVFSPTAGMGTRLVGNRILAFSPTIPITNVGNTPTKQMKDVASIYVSDKPIGQDFSFPDTGTVRPVFLGPKEPIHYTTEPVGIDTVVAVQQQRKHVYVYGWAKYRDVFRDTPEHLTEFCYELSIDRDIDIGDAKWTTDHSYNVASFNICPTEVGYNCADEECRDYEQKTKPN